MGTLGSALPRRPRGNIQGKVQRHRKSRMDARTRERLPVLPVLVRSAARQHADARALLQAARGTRPGDIITIPGAALLRAVTKTTTASTWASDPATGKRRNLTAEEDRAFWAWATVEVLRATGIRAEELVQLSHHSFVQYRLPGTGELVPLLQIVPSKTDAERLLVISPELADVLSAIISRIRGTSRSVPLVAAYEDHERLWLPPAPVLFQRRIGAENRAIPATTIRKILTAALARTGLTDPAGAPLHYTPHDFRRMFLTDGGCQLFGVTDLVGLLPSCAQAAVEGDVEGVEGGLPPVGPALAAPAGGVQAHDRQVQALERGLLGGEMPAGVHRPPQPGINRFDGIGRADHGPYFPVEGQERHELGPRVLPQPYDSRVAFLPFPGELGEPVQRLGLGRGCVNGLEVFRDLRPVPFRSVLE